jgi:hypothetical protein
MSDCNPGARAREFRACRGRGGKGERGWQGAGDARPGRPDRRRAGPLGSGIPAPALERGGLYVLSREFFLDLPKRLFGPGRFRFLLQPAAAVALGVAAGRADAREGRRPYLYALLLGGDDRGRLARSGLGDVANLVLVGILLDSVCQWLILGASHPGAALVVGPVLIGVPYAVARAVANRVAAFLERRRARG